jgi:predicted nucleic acid-binding protein
MDDIPKKEGAKPPEKMDDFAEELFQKIKEQNITIDPVVWTMLTHVLGNRTYAISLILGDLLDTPKWILKTSSWVMAFLYKLTGRKGGIYTIDTYAQKALNNTMMIKDFLNRLRETTQKKPGF